MTDTIQHHLTDDMLMAYSAGSLPEAFSLMVAAHLSLCDHCRAACEGFDAVGGALLEDNVVQMGDDSLSATLAMIASGPDRDTAPRRREVCDVLPAPLRDYVGGTLESVKWRSIGMGVRQAILPTEKGATARLLYIPAGTAVPDHGHHGTEMTMVLKGAFSDDGQRFARGDLEIADEAVDHTPVADAGEDCICLAVTDAPLRFRGLLPRLAQPFLKI